MKKKTVDAVLGWIEGRLEEDISVEDVVSFTGYSRRTIHDIFRDEVGMPVGKYIRHRRLCRAAVKLRLTTQSATEIAYQLCFDSQPSFNREFKKLYGVTPRQYRNNQSWDLASLQPPLNICSGDLPSIEICELPDFVILGCEVVKNINLPHSLNPTHHPLKSMVLEHMQQQRSDVLLASSFTMDTDDSKKIIVTTFIGDIAATESDSAQGSIRIFPGGLYAHARFTGGWDEYALFSHRIYLEALAQYSLKRRDARDIEYFHCLADDASVACDVFTCDFYIPVEQ